MISRSVSLKSFRTTLTFSNESSVCTGIRVPLARMDFLRPGSRAGRYVSGFTILTHSAHGTGFLGGATLAATAGLGWIGSVLAGCLAAKGTSATLAGAEGKMGLESKSDTVSILAGSVLGATGFGADAAGTDASVRSGFTASAFGVDANGFFDEPNLGSK